jgi:hypothetical protein
MKKEQFKNLVKSVQMLLEGRRGEDDYFGYGGERYANFPTEAEVPSGGYDDPAAVQSGLVKGSTPIAPHSNVSTSMGAHPSMVPKIQAKEFGASGKQLSLASHMPYPVTISQSNQYVNDPVIRDNLHELPPEAHSELLNMAQNVRFRNPESIRDIGRFLVQNGVDPAHPHVRKLFNDADFHEEHNRYSY